MKTYLLTGASGFVGGHLLDRAPPESRIVATYHTRPISLPGITYLSLDLEDPDAIRRAVERVHPHGIIHSAAWSNLEECQREPERARQINTLATEVLAETARELKARVIFISTDMVFDGEKGDYGESDETRPINVYGETKREAETLVMEKCPNSVVARTALIYGPPVTGSNSFSEKILEQVNRGESMPLFYDQYRTPVLVQDLAAALWELVGMDYTGIIHLGGRDRVDRYTFGLALAKAKGFPADLLQRVSMYDSPTEAPRPQDASLNSEKAAGLLKTRLSGYVEGVKRA
jgi:dTDP-4-dehydrorhamnose reductase